MRLWLWGGLRPNALLLVLLVALLGPYNCGAWLFGSSPKTFEFLTCNGFCNQRAGLVLGLIMAKILKRDVILPDLLKDGTQMGTDTALNGDRLPFAEVYSHGRLAAALALHGITVIPGDTVSQGLRNDRKTCAHFPGKCLEEVVQKTKSVRHLAFGCVWAEGMIQSSLVLEHRQLVADILQNLQPSPRLSRLVDITVDHIMRIAQTDSYNFVHVRAESDWLAHCQRWSSIPDGVVRDNCLTNTYELGSVMKSKGFDNKIPVYLTSHWPLIDEDVRMRLMVSMETYQYDYLTEMAVMPINDLSREEAALVNYYVGLSANKSIGNSVATFSALMILERRLLGHYAAQYNGGNIPIAAMFPLYRAPWVFAYSDFAEDSDGYLTRAAVRSAIAVGGLQPYCLYYGNGSSQMKSWLQEQNVKIIRIKPRWISWLPTAIMSRLRGLSLSAVVRDFLVFDAPLADELTQYDYVLYSAAHVYFRSHIDWERFHYPLPLSLGMRLDYADHHPGLAILNLETMRTQHDMLLNQVRVGAVGQPTARGELTGHTALAQFFHPTMAGWPHMPGTCYATAHTPFEQDAAAVFWLTVKPHDYVSYLHRGACRHGDLCREGLRSRGVCKYAVEWVRWSDANEAASQLPKLCKLQEQEIA